MTASDLEMIGLFGLGACGYTGFRKILLPQI